MKSAQRDANTARWL